jgi:hypothetical protein
VRTKTKRIKIDGKSWRVCIMRPPIKEVTDGLCDIENKTIYIHPDALKTCGIETICHELIHARLWDVCEEAVAEISELTGEVCAWAAQHNDGVII